MKLLTSLLAGLLFGLGLAISGMIDPARVIGFLDLAGHWDPSLAFVMGGALLAFMPGYLLVKPLKRSLLGNPWPAYRPPNWIAASSGLCPVRHWLGSGGDLPGARLESHFQRPAHGTVVCRRHGGRDFAR